MSQHYHHSFGSLGHLVLVGRPFGLFQNALAEARVLVTASGILPGYVRPHVLASTSLTVG